MIDLLDAERVVPAGRATTKAEAIREAGGLLVSAGAVEPAYVEAMFDREQQISTFMGNLLAIPHGTNEAKNTVLRSCLCLVRYPEPLDWDGNEVRVVVGIAAAGDDHLAMLSRIALVFSDMDRVQRVLDAGSTADLLAVFEEIDLD